jgi:hypothetical protein
MHLILNNKHFPRRGKLPCGELRTEPRAKPVPTPEAVETGRGSRFGMPELESAEREGLHDNQHRALF